MLRELVRNRSHSMAAASVMIILCSKDWQPSSVRWRLVS
jgi:hypothetical protein